MIPSRQGSERLLLGLMLGPDEVITLENLSIYSDRNLLHALI